MTRKEPEGLPDPALPEMQQQVRMALWKARMAVIREPESAAAWAEFGAACDAHQILDCAETCYRRASKLYPAQFESVYLLAIVLDRTKGDSDEPIELYQRAATLRPDYPPVQWRLGTAYEKRGRLPEALAAYRRSVDIDPNFGIGHRNAGQILLAMGDVDGALVHLKRAARLTAHDGAVFAALAQAFRRSGKLDGARSAAARARTLPPVYDVPDPVRNAVRSRVSGSAELYLQAKGLVSSGRYDKAIPLLEQCAAADPDDPEVHVFLATCFREKNKLDDAKRHAFMALQINDATMTAHLELAAAYIRGKDIENAYKHYERAQQLEPRNGKLDAWIGSMLARQGYADRASIAFDRAEELDGMDARAYWMWCVALLDIADAEGAVVRCRVSVEQNDSNPNTLYTLALALEQARRGDESIEYYERAAEIDPTHPAAERLRQLRGRGP